MTIYVPGKVTLRQTWQPMDPDAAAYITAVETADGQALEEKVKIAIDNFVLGCKADGIWSAIKASCILAGARTLAGALVPLVGTAPTNVGGLFVQADYNRKTGLVGDASTKYLDSNRLSDADPQDSFHLSVYVSTAPITSATAGFIGANNGLDHIIQASGSLAVRNRCGSLGLVAGQNSTTGFKGTSRSVGASFSIRTNRATSLAVISSVPRVSGSISVFARSGANLIDARLSFYSIGESLDLAMLDARVTDLINAFGVAIP
jgi:hypothetical protein